MKAKINNIHAYIKQDINRFLLILMVFVLPFERIPSVEVFGASIRLSVLIGLAIIARTLYLLIKKQLKLKFNFQEKLLVGFLVWIFLLIPESVNISRAISVFLFNSFTIMTALSIALIFDKKYIKPIIYSLLISATSVSAFAVFQYFGNLFGLSNNITGLRDMYSWEVFGFPRVQSFSLEPLYFASYLLLPFCVVYSLLINPKQKIISNKIALAQLSLFAFIIFLTVSRGALYAMIGVVLLGMFFALRLKLLSFIQLARIVAVLAMAAGLSLILINFFNKPPSAYTQGKKGASAYLSQLQNTSLDDNDGRQLARQRAIGIVRDEKVVLILGLGPGQFGPYVQNNIPRDGGKWTIVNNLTLELLVESGIVGVGLVIIFIVTLIYKGLKLFINSKDGPIVVLAGGLSLYLLSQAIQYQGYSTLYIIYIWTAIGLLMALANYSAKKG
jgi:O-antigen ligase